MSSFIQWLEDLNGKDNRVRAVLRRSLAFAPGMYVPAYPYVEPFVKEEHDSGRREMFYLVAGLWAAHWREGRIGAPKTIGKACAEYREASGSASTEHRFVNLLDSDPEQLPHRLRQVMALLKEHKIDFDHLLKGLLYWKDDRKRTQNNWARDFYRNTDSEM